MALTRRALLLGAGAAACAAAVATGGVLVSRGSDGDDVPGDRPAEPLVRQRADPHVTRHEDRYLFTASVPEYDRLVVRGAPTLAGLAAADERTVWTRPEGELGGHVWAPELHLVDGGWHVYFAAGTSDDPFRVRPYVLSADGPDPLTADWGEPRRIRTAWDSFSLDATTFSHRGTRYLVWAQQEDEIGPGTNLYISAMSGPATLIGPQARIAVPAHEWEKRGFVVNEGPAVIVRGDRVFCSFSASATDARYCVGLLTAAADADLLDPASWTKSASPVLRSNAYSGQYGPGHNCFTVTEDGRDLVVYHARDYEQIIGDPLFDPNRHTRVQRLYWTPDGAPDFGDPVGGAVLPVRLVPDSAPGTWLWDRSFRLTPGLAGDDSVSLESASAPGRFLVDRDQAVTLGASDGSDEFAELASFRRRPGLADPARASFESVRSPGNFLRSSADGITVEPEADPAEHTFTLD